MKRLILKSLVVPIALLLVAGSSSAQTITAADNYQSPRRFYGEFKLGPYAPNIDSQLPSGTALEHIFDSGQAIMFRWELDVQLFQAFGSLGIGGSVGYYYNSDVPFPDDGQTPSQQTDRSNVGSTTGIRLIPVALLGVYRFDWPAITYRIPLVPFVKVGLNYTFWRIDIDGQTSTWINPKTNQEYEASGGTFGWQFNAGVALLLDVLEPRAAKTLDVEMGINHSYLFFEFAHVDADGFGSEKDLAVGDTTWQGGIAFEF